MSQGGWLAIRCAAFACFSALVFSGCAGDTRHRLVVSLPDQKMLLITDGQPVAMYKVSTSKFGTGDDKGSYATPLGHLCVREKIGGGAPLGEVFKSRKPTGEVLLPNAPGRDPIVTRILWLEGLDPENRHAFSRYIYIHGTPQEALLGTPSSYGCIRMSSADIIELYQQIGRGARVEITTAHLAGVGAPGEQPL